MSGMYRITNFFMFKVGIRFLGEVRYFLLIFFLTVTEFVFILLELVLCIFLVGRL